MVIRLRRVSIWHIIGIALVLFAAPVAFFMVGSLVASSVHSGGCNHIPLVGGQPAYACPNLPH